jgi:hypothetical protein
MSTLNVGNIISLSSVNGGQLAGFRNILINGSLAINQRGVTYAAASVGDYWADRWKKTAAGMTQIIEEGNYKPLTPYTLSGTNVTTDTQTSPASGDWDISATFGDVIPGNALNIQLEEGTVATTYELRPVAIELDMCRRYYQTGHAGGVSYNASGSAIQRSYGSFTTVMRATPTVGIVVTSGSLTTPTPVSIDERSGFFFGFGAASAGLESTFSWTADAEL